MRFALGACAPTLAGKPTAGSTQRRKRSVFYNALGYAVEQGPPDLQPDRPDPVDRPRRRGDRRPEGRGQPRPGQEPPDCRPQPQRPGGAPGGVLRLPVLRGAAPVEGGDAPRERPAPAGQGVGPDRPGGLCLPGGHGLDRLRHRPPGARPEAPRRNETRTIPIPPELVQLLRAHIKRYGTTPDGRIFQTARGGIIQDSAYSAVWAEARKQALTRPSAGPRSAAAPTTCGTRRCPCG